jgi:Holliday junction DNA helicase RuvA
VQTASGVGPKLAQAILASLAPDELRVAVATDDAKTLTKVSGIGQKGAQRIILELKDRLGAPVGQVRNGLPASAAAPWKDQVLQGLVGLGWSAKDADAAVEAVAPEAGDDPQVAVLLRSALRTMSKA